MWSTGQWKDIILAWNIGKVSTSMAQIPDTGLRRELVRRSFPLQESIALSGNLIRIIDTSLELKAL